MKNLVLVSVMLLAHLAPRSPLAAQIEQPCGVDSTAELLGPPSGAYRGGMFGFIGAVSTDGGGGLPSWWFYASRYTIRGPGAEVRINLNPLSLAGLFFADAGVNYTVPTSGAAAIAFEAGIDVLAIWSEDPAAEVFGPYLGISALWNMPNGRISRLTVRVHALANDVGPRIISVGVGIGG